ncbi:MAG: hydroxyethylthiazole kinase [Actinomycetota bacterium]|jgi:hydroxyethylthiazole kinase|nr:hydroxyethylthiazole kinase [Actinomycetota bacterium]
MKAEEALRTIADEKPLVHHVTNYVTVNLVANVTLSTGALPVMAHAREEVAEMVSLASALVVNIGTLDPPFVEAVMLAGRRANEKGVPIVLDPVGAGATSFRTRTAERLLSDLEIAAVCGNAGEVATLAGLDAEVRGVESLTGDAETAARKAASSLDTTVAATGEIDYVSDGESTLAVANGHPLMARVVGSGCASTAVVGVFAAVGGAKAETVAHALAYFGRAGEVAAEGSEGGGTFEPRLIDAIVRLAEGSDRLDDTLRVEAVSGG